jgi:DNA-binding GntR family transcriptional regulator
MKRASLAKHVYNRLIDKFYAREYRPGDLIDRKRVAEEVGVSVGTVLIAVNQLEADGFVETLPRKGTLVRSVGFQEVLGQLLTREAFECQAARLYCGRPVEESLERLVPMARELDRVKDFDSQSIHLDGVFHTELIKLTQQPVFIDNYSKVNKLSSFFSFLYFSPRPTSPRSRRAPTPAASRSTGCWAARPRSAAATPMPTCSPSSAVVTRTRTWMQLRAERLWVERMEPYAADAAERLRELMLAGVDAIAQAPLADGAWRGVADVLRRVDRPSDLGGYRYEVEDTKLATTTRAATVAAAHVRADAGAPAGHPRRTRARGDAGSGRRRVPPRVAAGRRLRRRHRPGAGALRGVRGSGPRRGLRPPCRSRWSTAPCAPGGRRAVRSGGRRTTSRWSHTSAGRTGRNSSAMA